MKLINGKHHFVLDNKNYVFEKYQIDIMKKNKLKSVYVKMRIKNGWTVEDAVNAPYGMNYIEYKDLLIIQELEINEMIRKRRCRKPKPWLDHYPQKTLFGDYAQLLFDECCGSW